LGGLDWHRRCFWSWIFILDVPNKNYKDGENIQFLLLLLRNGDTDDYIYIREKN
jgi:hypothetical protein